MKPDELRRHTESLEDTTARDHADAGRDAEAAAAAAPHMPFVEARFTAEGLQRHIPKAVVERLIVAFRAAAQASVYMDEMLQSFRLRGLDVGHAETRAALDQFAANEALDFSASDAAMVKGLATERLPVTAADIAAAWAIYRPFGKRLHVNR